MKMDIQGKDEIIFDTLKISLKKLKKILTKPKIKKLYETFLKKKQQCNKDALYLVPFKVLSSVVQSKVQKLSMKQLGKQNGNSLFHIYKINLFNQLAHVKFTNLTILNLSKQTLHSLQALGYVDAPKLRCLQLHHNLIINLNILVKAEFRKLEVITFYHNPITQIEKLCRFHSKKLTGYEFDRRYTYQNRVEDYRFLFKMQNPIIKMLKAHNVKRIDISQSRIYEILNQPGAKILIERPIPQERIIPRMQTYLFQIQD